MRAPTTALLAAALGLAACQAPPGGPPPPAGAPAPAAPSAVPVTGALAVHDGEGRAGPLRLADLARLSLDATYRGEPGRHPLRIDVFGPSGLLYAQLRGAFEAGSDGEAAASRVLEVRGTPIDGYHMVGTWQLVLVVDGGRSLASARIDIVD